MPTEKTCDIILTVDLGFDLNALEEDTVIEEFNHVLRQGSDFHLDRYGGFISNYHGEGVYDVMTNVSEVPFEDLKKMKMVLIHAMDMQGVDIDDEDVIIEARPMTKIYRDG